MKLILYQSREKQYGWENALSILYIIHICKHFIFIYKIVYITLYTLGSFARNVYENKAIAYTL